MTSIKIWGLEINFEVEILTHAIVWDFKTSHGQATSIVGVNVQDQSFSTTLTVQRDIWVEIPEPKLYRYGAPILSQVSTISTEPKIGPTTTS